MNHDIKLVAVDIDGTFVRSDYTYDISRFKRILSCMENAGCNFVVASGNQYYQLRDLFPGYCDELSFVAENGAFVKTEESWSLRRICRKKRSIGSLICAGNILKYQMFCAEWKAHTVRREQ